MGAPRKLTGAHGRIRLGGVSGDVRLPGGSLQRERNARTRG